MNIDEIITRITEAKNKEAAKAIVCAIPYRMLLAIADQLYIEAEGHGVHWIRNAIIKEART